VTTFAYGTRRWSTPALLIVCCLALCPSVARSQRLDDLYRSRLTATNGTVAVATRTPTEANTRWSVSSAVVPGPAPEVRVRRALVGGLVGAAVGTVAAYSVTHKRNVTSHEMDALAYVFLVPVGTVIGVLGGALWPSNGAR
jgi:hypothetical protein